MPFTQAEHDRSHGQKHTCRVRTATLGIVAEQSRASLREDTTRSVESDRESRRRSGRHCAIGSSPRRSSAARRRNAKSDRADRDSATPEIGRKRAQDLAGAAPAGIRRSGRPGRRLAAA
jgi:hypothetical protein